MDDQVKCFSIEQGWLVIRSTRIQMGSIIAYGCEDTRVWVKTAGGGYETFDLPPLHIREPFPSGERTVMPAVELMTALDLHFWAKPLEADPLRAQLVRDLIAYGIGRDRIAKIASCSVSSVIALMKADGLSTDSGTPPPAS